MAFQSAHHFKIDTFNAQNNTTVLQSSTTDPRISWTGLVGWPMGREQARNRHPYFGFKGLQAVGRPL
jgi:hypothetical protein